MFKYNNYPLHNDSQYPFTIEDILIYLSVFNDHRIAIYYKQNYCYSYHVFNDGLEIKIIWNIYDNNQMLKHKGNLNINKLIELNHLNIIRYKNFEYLSFSHNYHINEDEKRLFNFILRSSGKKYYLSHNEYLKLEFEVEQQCSISDDFFNNLIKQNQNYLLFHKYLKENNLN